MESCGRKIGPFDCCTIVVGDCLDVMAEMPDGCVDLVVTDPPYGTGYVSNRPKCKWGIHQPIPGDDDSIWANWHKFIARLVILMRDNSAAFFCTRWDKWIELDVFPLEPRNMIVWDKGNHSAGDLQGNFGFAHELIMFATKGRAEMRGRRIWNIWRVPRIPAERLWHSAEKPVALMELAISSMSDKGDTVFDPFMGSGTTAVAAQKLDRHFFGCDINPEYVAMAEKRLSTIQLAMEL